MAVIVLRLIVGQLVLGMSFKATDRNHFGWGAHRLIHYKKQNNVQYLANCRS
ncbi:hypothetical protein [Heyndrickxia oleronia]|uniref:hypothetical protein n=1 Tax=Heyndrickxia oleronia TaxID=38875 RepID=UPI001BB41561|nr:hypothetical protein [Heyndrickxia oleronia]